MLAVVVARDGVLPSGADEVIAECGGRVLLCGSGTAIAAEAVRATEIRTLETGPFLVGVLAEHLAHVIDDPAVVLPASADGRDLAPRLAHRLARDLFAPTIRVTATAVSLVRGGGREIHEVALTGPFVATLVPGVRGIDPVADRSAAPSASVSTSPVRTDSPILDVELIEVSEPDLATMDLTEAPRIIGGGAGLDSAERFHTLARVGAALGAAVGATRVVTDRGWLEHSRQIGTTGAVVHPSLYLAFGISGAVQHTTGLGDPDHIISVNTDAHCPMMQMADLAIVADANAVVDALVERITTTGGSNV